MAWANGVEERVRRRSDTEEALDQLNRFCKRVNHSLNGLGFEERQALLRLVVERVVVDGNRVRVDTVIPPSDDAGELRARRPDDGEGRNGGYLMTKCDVQTSRTRPPTLPERAAAALQ